MKKQRYESDEYSIRNKRSEYIGNYATYHKIRIDDKKPKEVEAIAIDRVIKLLKSTLAGRTVRVLEKAIDLWNDLPSEKQVRELPKEAKENVEEFLKGFKRQSENYKNYQSDERAKPAMRINDKSDKTTTVIDTDYFKDIQVGKIVDFPYSSIGAIMKDKSLSFAQKSELCDKYMEAKTGTLITPKEEPMKPDSHYQLDMENNELVEDIEIVKSAKTPREMFETLCKLYPRRFMNADKGVGHKIGWLRKERNTTFIPTLITVDPFESKKYEERCAADSTLTYRSDAYFSKGLNMYVYFVRTEDGKTPNK